jgi:hypothetical protein
MRDISNAMGGNQRRPGQEANQTRPSAKLWTEFSTLHAPMYPTRIEMVQAEVAFIEV